LGLTTTDVSETWNPEFGIPDELQQGDDVVIGLRIFESERQSENGRRSPLANRHYVRQRQHRLSTKEIGRQKKVFDEKRIIFVARFENGHVNVSGFALKKYQETSMQIREIKLRIKIKCLNDG
jgi:hypothetical protein